MVQWLGLSAFTTVAWVQSLVGEMKFPQAMRLGQKKKKKRKKAGNKGVFKGRFLALNVLENESEIKHTTQ